MYPNNMDLTISIVSYNLKDLLKKCISSIYKYLRDMSFEIIVIDNGSKDGTVEMVRKEFSKVKIIANRKNLFFAKANNQALKIAKGKYFLILNSDTYFIDNSIKKMIVFMEENKNIAASEGLEFYENGKIVPTGSRFSSPLIDFFELSIIGKRLARKKIIDNYRFYNKNRKKNFEIDVGCDAFLCVRKAILDQIGGYDENFCLFYTENDLCLRIKKKGYRIMHLGSAKVIHRVSASTKSLGWKKTDIYYKDLLHYYKKNNYYFSGSLLFILLKLEEKILKFLNKC